MEVVRPVCLKAGSNQKVLKLRLCSPTDEGRPPHLLGQLGGLQVNLPNQALHVVVRHGDVRAVEGARLNDVSIALQVGAVDLSVGWGEKVRWWGWREIYGVACEGKGGAKC